MNLAGWSALPESESWCPPNRISAEFSMVSPESTAKRLEGVGSIRIAISPVAGPTAQVRHSCVASMPACFRETLALDQRMPSQYPTRR